MILLVLWQLTWLLLSLACVSWPLAPSHTENKQILKMEPVSTNRHTHTHIQHQCVESGCQNWMLAERCEMLWHFTSLHFPRLLWMLQQRCQPKRRPVWIIVWAHASTQTHTQGLDTCTFIYSHCSTWIKTNPSLLYISCRGVIFWKCLQGRF